jgi:hypothetical protein
MDLERMQALLTALQEARFAGCAASAMTARP